MSRIRKHTEDSAKHRFHGLEHDPKMRLSTTHSYASTLRGYEPSGTMLEKQKTENGQRTTKAGNGLHKTQR